MCWGAEGTRSSLYSAPRLYRAPRERAPELEVLGRSHVEPMRPHDDAEA
jgi:hypothetical protein